MAEQLGATCSTEVDASVTHVVSGDVGMEKSLWAVREGKFSVGPMARGLHIYVEDVT